MIACKKNKKKSTTKNYWKHRFLSKKYDFIFKTQNTTNYQMGQSFKVL
jgi:hypothetical protein